MKKILFATEFSGHTTEVFKFAADLAYFFQAELLIMHAFGRPEPIKTNRTLEERTEVVTDKMLDLVAISLSDDYETPLNIRYIPKVGFAAEALLQVALEEEVDFIVMGMKGKTNAINTLFGSTTLSVLNKAKCPVLIVPAIVKFSGISSIVYTNTFEFRDIAAINYLKEWAKVFNVPVYCAHVLEKEEKEWEVSRKWNTLKETYKGENSISFAILKGIFKATIETFATQKGADIIVMTDHQRNFISRIIGKSTVEGIARHTQFPLLVLKDNADEFRKKDLEDWVENAKPFAT